MKVPSRATRGVNFRPVTSPATAPPTSPSSALKKRREEHELRRLDHLGRVRQQALRERARGIPIEKARFIPHLGQKLEGLGVPADQVPQRSFIGRVQRLASGKIEPGPTDELAGLSRHPADAFLAGRRRAGIPGLPSRERHDVFNGFPKTPGIVLVRTRRGQILGRQRHPLRRECRPKARVSARPSV